MVRRAGTFAFAVLVASSASAAPSKQWDGPNALDPAEVLEDVARPVAPIVSTPKAVVIEAPEEDGDEDIREGIDVQSPEEIEAARRRIEHDFAGAIQPETLKESDEREILHQYEYLDPDHVVPKDLLDTAVLYFGSNRERFSNQNFLTVVDYRPRSDHYRLFVINLKTGGVERFHTTHGKGSVVHDRGYAERFGNVPDSLMSSLGFVRTAEVYVGHVRRAIRLDGLSDTNSNMRARAIVMHGRNGVHEANVIQAVSNGCLALDWKIRDHVIDEIKEGSLLYSAVSKEP